MNFPTKCFSPQWFNRFNCSSGSNHSMTFVEFNSKKIIDQACPPLEPTSCEEARKLLWIKNPQNHQTRGSMIRISNILSAPASCIRMLQPSGLLSHEPPPSPLPPNTRDIWGRSFGYQEGVRSLELNAPIPAVRCFFWTCAHFGPCAAFREGLTTPRRSSICCIVGRARRRA